MAVFFGRRDLGNVDEDVGLPPADAVQVAAQQGVADAVREGVEAGVNTGVREALKYIAHSFIIEKNIDIAFPVIAVFAGSTAGAAMAYASRNVDSVMTKFASVFGAYAGAAITTAIPVIGIVAWELEFFSKLPSRKNIENQIFRISRSGLSIFKSVVYPSVGTGIILGGAYVGKLIGEGILQHAGVLNAADIDAGSSTFSIAAKALGTLSILTSSVLYMSGVFKD